MASREGRRPRDISKLDFPPSEDRSPQLKAVKVNLVPSPELYSTPLPPSPSPERSAKIAGKKGNTASLPSKGDGVLVNYLGGHQYPDIANRAAEHPLVVEAGPPESPGGGGGSDEEDMDAAIYDALPSNQDLAHVAKSSLRITEQGVASDETLASRSAPERPRPTIITKPSLRAEGRGSGKVTGKPEHGSYGSNSQADGGPSLQRAHSADERSPPGQPAHLSPVRNPDSIANSLHLRQFVRSGPAVSPLETLPAMHASPPPSASSPGSSHNLPSIHSQLGSLADGPPPSQPLSLSNRQGSFSTSNALNSPPSDFSSPRGPSYPPLSARTTGSYSSAYPATEPSPASAQSGPSPRDPFAPVQTSRSLSPPSKFGPRQYSGTQGLAPSDVQTPISASSQSSYRTLGTEPSPVSERNILDPERPILLPPPSGPLVGGGFKCDYPECAAAPFQTQYLLNSHANVHSSSRPHYCPVKHCSRSEGGRGFKRKNEMIRHGLVHQSPGYICPFCPEREHRYPRPDNLQRHVRVHHVDKDKDDPLLREVLSQRADGGNRGRRRRANS